MEYLLIFAAIILAGTVQGATGFGFSLVSVALLSVIMDLREASILVVLASLSVNSMLFWQLRGSFHWPSVRVLLLSALVGVPVGVFFLAQASGEQLRLALGLILVLAGLQSLIPGLAHYHWPRAAGYPFGFFSGVLTGAFNTGGPPAVAYFHSQGFDRFRYAASLQLVFASMTLIRLILLGASGLFSIQLVLSGIVGSVFAIAGGLLGFRFLQRVPDQLFRRGTAVMLLFLGLSYLL